MPCVDSCSQSLRPAQPSSAFTLCGEHPLDQPSTPPKSPPESPERPRSRRSSRPLSAGGKVQLRGPERFFYDKASYTGVHARGGPSVINRSSFVSDLRPDQHKGSSFTRTAGHPLDSDKVRDRGLAPPHIDSMVCRSPSSSRATSPAQPQQRSSDCFGPERFFYDKTTYTGCHAHGGIDRNVPSDGFMQALRPSQHLGSTFTHVGGHPLHRDGPRSVDTMPGSLARQKKRRASVGSLRELKGPQRLFYDTSSYTGVHKHGGPTTIDENSSASWINSMRPGMH